MSEERDILLVTVDPDVAASVAEAISGSGDRNPVERLPDLAALQVELERSEAPIVLVDVDGTGAPGLQQLESIIELNPQTRFVVLASKHRPDWMIEAMHVGARSYLRKDDIGSDLIATVDRLATPLLTRNGHLSRGTVTVMSAGGGCGATTIAINLGVELAALVDRSVLLVDLDCRHGGLAGCLGLSAEYGLADLLEVESRIDAQLVRSTAVAYNDRLHLLASPATVASDTPVTPQFSHLSKAMSGVRHAYPYSIVDASNVDIAIAAQLASTSLATLILFEMNVEDIRIARATARRLEESGTDRDTIIPIANRYHRRRAPITLAEARTALDDREIRCLPDDYKNAAEAINFGKTLAEIAPRSPLRRELQRLAESINEVAQAEEARAGR